MTTDQEHGEHLRMDAYYYSFERTGVLAIDRVLSAVATAGKHYHHTESWSDDEPDSEADAIQRVAQTAADDLSRLLARAEAAEAQVARYDELTTNVDWLRTKLGQAIEEQCGRSRIDSTSLG